MSEVCSVGSFASGATEWLTLISALLAAVAAALGIPPLITRLRESGGDRKNKPRVLLPSRAQLVDRGNEVAQALRHLDQGEYLVSIEGSIGVGKSALAVEVAHRLAERISTKKPRGAYTTLVWLDAHNGLLRLADLARTLALATGNPTLSAAPAENKAEALRSHLADNPAVLVIDNLRLTATDAQHLIDFLKTLPSGSIAIVSANTPGRLPAPRVLLQELQLQFMQELLLREARRRGVPEIVEADPTTFERIHRLLGGNPRAIELFVLACSRDSRSLSEQIDQLEGGSVQLADALFSAVWQDMDQTTRHLLRVCAYLGGSANLEQLRTALAAPDIEVEPRVERLWSDGLLASIRNLGATTYTTSAALRLFVINHTSDDQTAPIASRLADHFIDRFSHDWEDAAGASMNIDAIRILIQDLARRGSYEQCVRLFEVTLDIFFTLGLFDDRIELGWTAYEAATALGNAEQRSLALSVISSTHAVRGEVEEAARTAQMGLNIARESGSMREIARQLRCVGFSQFRAGNAAEALAAVKNSEEDAEEMARQAGDPNNMIDIQSLVGAAHWHLRDLDSCDRTVRRFLQACEQLPWERGKAYAIRDLAEVTLMRRAFTDAGLLLDQARQIATEYRDVRQLVRIDLTQARLSLFRGRLIKARKYARKAAVEARRLSLSGEQSEAEATQRHATRALTMPWLRLATYRRPRFRFTDQTIGGD